MSKTSAYGTEYYRVVYDFGGVIDGPYTSAWMARRVANSAAPGSPYAKSKIQKLVPMFEECGCCLTLGWDDYELHN